MVVKSTVVLNDSNNGNMTTLTATASKARLTLIQKLFFVSLLLHDFCMHEYKQYQFPSSSVFVCLPTSTSEISGSLAAKCSKTSCCDGVMCAILYPHGKCSSPSPVFYGSCNPTKQSYLQTSPSLWKFH